MRSIALAILIVIGGALIVHPGSSWAVQSQDAQTSAAAVTNAALQRFNAVSQVDCLDNDPEWLDCVALESTPSDIQGGIAIFGVADPDGNNGFTAAMGRMQDGSWRLWFTSNDPYQPTRLPSEMVVCAGGDGVNVHSGPSADSDVIDALPDGAGMTGVAFVLTEPVDPGHAGFGWFQISDPDSGWVYSKYLEAGSLNDGCALHDA